MLHHSSGKKDHTAEDTAFFLKKHGVRILLYTAVFVLTVVLAGLYFSTRASREDEASVTFLGAQKAEDHQKIATEFSGSPYAPLALMARAKMLYDAKRYDDAAAAFSEMVRAYPRHELAARATAGLAFCLESKGDFDGALHMFEKAQGYESHKAWNDDNVIGIARCKERLGLTREALVLYEDFLAKRPGSMWSEVVGYKISLLKRQVAEKS